jgi:hypothetical protein
MARDGQLIEINGVKKRFLKQSLQVPRNIWHNAKKLQLADSLAQISRANKAEQALKKPLLLGSLRSAARRLP